MALATATTVKKYLSPSLLLPVCVRSSSTTGIGHAFPWKPNSGCCVVHLNQLRLVHNFRRVAWSIRSSIDGSGLDPSSANSTNGSTRLIKAIQSIQAKLDARIQEFRKNLPLKLLFFLVGFYCATAFATVIGQTGDWDILSAALAVVVVEGIGALMYSGSLRLLNKIGSLITLFNYWKAGLSLGLFLDSFKYEVDHIMDLSNLFNFEIDALSGFLYLFTVAFYSHAL